MKTRLTSAAGKNLLARLSAYTLIVALLAPLTVPLRAKAISESARAVFNPPTPVSSGIVNSGERKKTGEILFKS